MSFFNCQFLILFIINSLSTYVCILFIIDLLFIDFQLDLPLLSSPLKPKLSSNSSIQTVQSRATRSNPQLSDVLPKIEEEGGGEGESKSWNECEELISSLNFSLEESNTILRKAFGFKHSPYWGEERIREIPTKETVNFSLNYLRGLGLSDDDLHKLLVKFPEVIGCDLDTELKSNVASLEKEWGIKGKVLRRLLLRNPKVLGFNVDCKGDCFAKCTRCWVRF